MGFLENLRTQKIFSSLDRHGRLGVEALARSTPSETGETANAWEYQITRGRGSFTIEWSNTHVEEDVNVAVILQYGHGTGTGGYVRGRDYINPAMRPVFDQIAEDVWKEVMNA